jgi:4-alpha-glucanotransferase
VIPPRVVTDRWGIDSGYEDALGTWRETPPDTRRALLDLMGAVSEPEGGEPRVLVIRRGEGRRLDGGGEIALEDGGVLTVRDVLPADLPLGYHELRPARAREPVRLIVSPGRCHLPPDLRTWGWAVQLYAARSRQSWGFGDLADLDRLARWSAREGAGILLVNPLLAAAPIVGQQPSPYYPSSRRYRNPLYLRVEEVPGATDLGPELERIAREGRALNADRRIDRDRVFRLKTDALERVWKRTSPGDELEQYLRAEGQALQEFATFCVLVELHGADWRGWPAEHRDPSAPGVARLAEQRRDRVRFHGWMQWLVDRQLARASEPLAIMQDLPIGVDPGGADAWAWQDVVTDGASVGAPPDTYNRRGQDWGLPPFLPRRLQARGYEPFIQTVRAALRHAGGLRIDHIMGLFRLFWIPRGAVPAEGAFVRYPADDLLAILALESHRARAVVVGEDLGTVEAGVRERLAAHGILSYRLVWFENGAPKDYPRQALAAINTHDLPTIAGLWTGSDVKVQQALGLEPNVAGLLEIRDRLAAITDLDGDAPVAVVIEHAHRSLATAPSAIITATLDDALAVTERPNMPQTVTEWPNWSIALPLPLEEIESAPLARSIAVALDRRGTP